MHRGITAREAWSPGRGHGVLYMPCAATLLRRPQDEASRDVEASHFHDISDLGR
jgi:hypothetical protein